ncbi:MAG: fused MFS/spermidine synthase [Candidatus Andersenbacteria bacterium]
MSTSSTISDTYWYTFLFIVGTASIAVEIAGLRFLAPLFGSSLPVWGLAIAAVLAGLAWGYTRGGQLAGQGNALALVFRQAAWGSTIFLWMPAVFALAIWLRDISFAQASVVYIIPAFLLPYGILLVSSVTFGMVNPLAVQAEADRRNQPAGQVAGRISALTTTGSLAGILIPSFITIPLLGSHITVWLFAGVALALSAGPLVKERTQLVRMLSLAAIAILVTLAMRSYNENILFAKETRHQYVTVHQQDNTRTLIFDASLGIQSVFTPDLYTDGYWDYMASLPALLPETDIEVSVLALGAAASTTERQMQRFWQDTRIFKFTSVELDSELFDIADAYFDPPERQTVTADARIFTASSANTYDIIAVDTYAREVTIPFHLATTQFFAQLADRLADHGVIAVNINATSADTLWVRSLARTLHEQFPHVRLVHVPQSCNYLLLASHISLPTDALAAPAPVIPLLPALRNAIPPRTDGLLLTDDRSPTDLLGFAAFIRPMSTFSCDRV